MLFPNTNNNCIKFKVFILYNFVVNLKKAIFIT